MHLMQYEQRTIKKRLAILNATKTLICHHPIEDLTIHLIARQAKASQVTIYNIFGNKKALINEAIRILSQEDIEDIVGVISSTLPIEERLFQYFNHSFNHSVEKPKLKGILDYIFNQQDVNLKDFILSEYAKTMPYLIKLYEDGRKEALIRATISAEQFLKMLDMYTQIDRSFLLIPHEKELIIESILKSFR